MVDDEPILIGMLVRVASAHIIEDSIRAQLASQGRNPSIRAAAWQALQILDKPHDYFAAMRYEHLNTLQNTEALFETRRDSPDFEDFYQFEFPYRLYTKIPRIEAASLSNVNMMMAGWASHIKREPFEFFSFQTADKWLAAVPVDGKSFLIVNIVRPNFDNAGSSIGKEYARRNTLMQAVKLLENPTVKTLPLKGRYALDSDGKPLRLIRKPNKLILYSIGPNDADDGGILERPTTGTRNSYDFGVEISR